jgi:hypothetical protein
MNITKIKAAAEIAKSKTSDKRWIAAINKAVAGVESGWIVTYETHGIMVTTENGTYRANGSCQCKAFAVNTPCKHRALARLVEMADEMEAAERAALRCEKIIEDIKAIGRNEYPATFKSDVAAAPREHLILEITNIWPRYSTTPLAIALESRFGCNNLNALDIDLLRRVRLAIAA